MPTKYCQSLSILSEVDRRVVQPEGLNFRVAGPFPAKGRMVLNRTYLGAEPGRLQKNIA
jgi:hypothetical protein